MLTSAFVEQETPRLAGGELPHSMTMDTQAMLGRITVPGREESVSHARNFVANVLGRDHPCRDEARLLTSELVTNAVQHSESRQPGGLVIITVAGVPGGIRVEVTDDGSSGSVPVVRATTLDTCGRGLHLVSSLCEDWGYVQQARSTTVWFRLTW
jgi:anti-sigma regulatory factor (Ser/Thr protein kinase)